MRSDLHKTFQHHLCAILRAPALSVSPSAASGRKDAFSAVNVRFAEIATSKRRGCGIL